MQRLLIVSKELLCFKNMLCCICTFLAVQSTQAIEISLEDWIFNIDGTISENFAGDPLPTTGSLVDGLGTLSLDVSGAGSHNVIGFFDFEIDEGTNTFFNESGMATGLPGLTQSWEIDEPGFVFGDIVDNVFLGALDNSNSVPAGSEDDVSFALGWDFSLLAQEVASIDFVFTDILPSVDFFLTHTDSDLGESFYFYSTLGITSVIDPVGVPGTPTHYLLLLGFLALLLNRKFFIRKSTH